MKSLLTKFRHFTSLLKLPLYERRKKFNPITAKRGLLFRLYIWLCRIRYTEGNVVYDEAIKVSYELNTDIGNTLYYTGEFESSELSFIQNKVLKAVNKPVILDIGANIGLHSLKFAKSNVNVIVYAFEPSPHTRKLLEYNIKANKLVGKVKVFSQAVSDRIGIASFFETEDNAYSSLKDTRRKRVTNTVDVQLTTIDNFIEVEKLDKIDLIKIDVEGFDNEVIRGGLESFKKLKPVIFIEIYKGTNSNPDPELTIRTLINIGYKAFILDNGKPVPYTQHSDRMYNYYFTMN